MLHRLILSRLEISAGPLLLRLAGGMGGMCLVIDISKTIHTWACVSPYHHSGRPKEEAASETVIVTVTPTLTHQPRVRVRPPGSDQSPVRVRRDRDH